MQNPLIRRMVRWSILAASLPMAFAAGAAEPAGDEIEELEVVEVTGSRISRSVEDIPNPVVTIGAEVITQSGATNLTSLLAQSPALLGSFTKTDASGAYSGDSTGLNLLDLRNLGTSRTLVLVNGRRHVAGAPGSASVDINTIPMDLIERVDVLTGGASAIYGADGVSGVVNFVTRRNFEGVKARVQTGLSEYGDAGSTFASFTAGQNFAGGRGNVALAYEFGADDPVYISDRRQGGDPLSTWGLTNNPDYEEGNPDQPYYTWHNDMRWLDSSLDGGYDTDWDYRPNYTGTGAPFDLGTLLNGTYTQGGSSTPVAGYNGNLQAKTRKHVVNLLGSFDFTDSARGFIEAKYAQTHTWNAGQPTFEFFTFVSAENPFMPDVIRDAIDADEAAANGMPPGVLLNRDNTDLARTGQDFTRDTLRGVVGLEGKLTDNVKYEVSYTYGQTKAKSDQPGNRLQDRFYAALDAVDEGQYLTGTPNGNIRCRIDLDPAGSVIDPYYWNYGDLPSTFTPGPDSGCVPLNLFGVGVADPAAMDFVNYRLIGRQKITQQVASGSLSGDLANLFELPGGPLAWAVGAEWRKEKSLNDVDPMLETGGTLWGYDLPVLDETGGFNVKEAFAEVNLPLAKDAPFAKYLAIGGAARFSDYSTVGKTTAWKTDLVYAPVAGLTLRGTYSEAVRAPNISELFAPTTGTYDWIDDPCDVEFIGEGEDPALRAQNCAAILEPLGVDLSTFSPYLNSEFAISQPGLSKGNADLTEETAKTWTAGFTLRPNFLPGFSFGFDWFDIKLKNAIRWISAQEVINLCVDSPMPNQYCDSVDRLAAPDPDVPTYEIGFIRQYRIAPANVAAYTTAGADATVDYAFTPSADIGRFTLRLVGNYVDKLTFTSLPGAPVTNSLDAAGGAPRYSGDGDLTWSKGPWTVNYGVSWFSKTRRVSKTAMDSREFYTDPENVWYRAKWQHDVRAAFDFGGRAGATLYGGVNNLFGRKPDKGTTSYPMSFEGRYFYVGVSVSADSLQ